MEEPIGTRVIASTPPATATSYWPLSTPAAAKCTACCDEPHCRSTVVPGIDSGQRAPSTALRPTLSACSPTWLTVPQMTSSTTAGSMAVPPPKPPDGGPRGGGVDSGPLGQRAEDVRRQVDRVDVLVRAVALADRGPDGVDDDRVTHGFLRALRGGCPADGTT